MHPAAGSVVVTILPAHAPGDRFHDDILRTNAPLDAPDAIHLAPAGFATYAARPRPELTRLVAPGREASATTAR